MEKPKRIFAVLLWVLGFIFLAGGVLKTIAFIEEIIRIELTSGADLANRFMLTGATTNYVMTSFLDGGFLAGLGLLIELVDQVLWNGLSEDQRAARLKRSRRFWNL